MEARAIAEAELNAAQARIRELEEEAEPAAARRVNAMPLTPTAVPHRHLPAVRGNSGPQPR